MAAIVTTSAAIGAAIRDIFPALAQGLLGSADLFDKRGRRPWSTVNFVTAHDGFTLADVVSYNRKHNEANSEGNRDGHDDNRSWNCGQKGPTNDTKILALRDRLRRGLMATLLISQGTPMILMGDEVGRSQRGNNNAYCQDNEISWLDWSSIGERDAAFFAFTRELIRLRKRLRLLRQTRFLHGEEVGDDGTKNVVWLTPDGAEMTPADWNNGLSKSIGLMLCGTEDPPLLLLTNSHSEELSFRLDAPQAVTGWQLLVDTARGVIEPRRARGRSRRLRCVAGAGAPPVRGQALMGMRYAFERSWGAELLPEGGARFRLWAPGLDAVSLLATESGGTVAMARSENGWFELSTDVVAVGAPYMFQLPNGMKVPDPAARAQQRDVHGPSLLTDPRAYEWRSGDWQGRPWEEAIIYELHTGTFTRGWHFCRRRAQDG